MSCPNHLGARRAESEISFEALGMVAVPVAVKAENSRSCRDARPECPKEGAAGGIGRPRPPLQGGARKKIGKE